MSIKELVLVLDVEGKPCDVALEPQLILHVSNNQPRINIPSNLADPPATGPQPRWPSPRKGCAIHAPTIPAASMFVLHTMKDTVRVPPDKFGHGEARGEELLALLIDEKYANKVLPNVGLCVTLYDFLHIGDSFTYPGDGSAHAEVQFRVLVFSPFRGELLEGTVKYCTSDRVVISLGFFEDIILPPDALPQPSVYDYEGRMWSWKYESTDEGKEEFQDGEGLDENSGFYITQSQRIRFKVSSIRYNNAASASATDSISNSNNEFNALLEKQRSQSLASESEISNLTTAPMALLATIREMGLGPLEWWPTDEPDEDEEASQNGET